MHEPTVEKGFQDALFLGPDKSPEHSYGTDIMAQHSAAQRSIAQRSSMTQADSTKQGARHSRPGSYGAHLLG
jgi:hypothetical protein